MKKIIYTLIICLMLSGCAGSYAVEKQPTRKEEKIHTGTQTTEEAVWLLFITFTILFVLNQEAKKK